MNKFFNFLKAWQGIISTAVIILAFCLMPVAFSFLRVSSGTIDWAYLQGLAFSTIVFFSAILCTWIAVQCDWKIFTQRKNSVSDDWNYLTPFQRTLIMQGVIMSLILFYILCFAFLPKP